MTDPFDDEPVPPACEPTVARLQAVLDGELGSHALDADPHAAACPACRDRARAARLLLAALAEPAEPVAVPVRLTNAILAGVRADRRQRARRQVAFAAGRLAVAAGVLFAAWWFGGGKPPEPGGGRDIALIPPVPPTPEVPPAPRPIRINEEIAKAGEALRDSSRTITEPATSGTKVFASFTGALPKRPPAPPGAGLEPARRTLAEIPAAAKSGLEPVTESAQRAFHRLLKDVAAMSPGKPKS